MTNGPILLVEDNDDDVVLVRRAMKKGGIDRRIVVASDGLEALDYLHGRGAYMGRDATDVPWIVLLDLKLPKIDGLQTLARLRATDQTKLVPVVILSSSRDERDVITSYSLGANSYVRKPGDFFEFTQALLKLHDYWLVNEMPPVRRRAS
jgi:two-component system, response regulator